MHAQTCARARPICSAQIPSRFFAATRSLRLTKPRSRGRRTVYSNSRTQESVSILNWPPLA
eukprot:6172709-Pleurochrysis_carterae.AAC.1